MNQLFDFLPIVAFAAAYFAFDIYYATGALMVAVSLQVFVYWLTKRPIGNEIKLTFWASWVLGGLTLYFRDEAFVQWKPSIVNWALALTLLLSKYIGNRNLLQSLLGKQLKLPEHAWTTLNYGWAAAFTLAGVLNLVVAFNFSMDIWVTYKLIGGFALTFCFIIATMLYLSRGGYLDELTDDTEPATAGASALSKEAEVSDAVQPTNKVVHKD